MDLSEQRTSSPSGSLPLRALTVLGLVALVIGWHFFRFTCDDAFIAFRYIANRRLGWGYTWNPPPFPAVEGYTSFLWVILLDLTWSLTGLAPPETADWISLACAVGTVLLIARAMRDLPLPAGWSRPAALALVLAGTLSNRTFLAWTSSGLESSLWMLLVVAWTDAAFRGSRLSLGLLAGLLGLCRPDGYLFLGATAVVLLSPGDRRGLLGFLPVAAHLLWRHSTYGAWLPNTFAAKVGAPWPEAGLRYLASFILEYAFFLWIPLLVAVRGWRPTLPALLALAALAAHAAYYVLVVGGDHFEYRIFAPLVPLLWIAGVAALPRCGLPPRVGLLLGTLALALSWPIPWTHWRLTHDLNTRTETYVMIEPVAPSLPGFGPWVRAWDDLQSWLILHQVGVRHQEHKVFGQLQARRYPSRASVLGGTGLLAAHEVGGTAVVDAGRRPDLAGWPAIDLGTAGSGWYLGPLALIDTNGLNDPVVARSPYDTSTRLMGHEKVAPAGYVSCYRPNVCPALLISRRSDGAMVSVATPSPAWWMDMDVTAPEIPLPENLRGRESELIARAVFLVIDRDPPLTAAQVAGCVARDWSHSPPPHDEPWRTLQGLEAIAQRGAVVRARAREVHAGRG